MNRVEDKDIDDNLEATETQPDSVSEAESQTGEDQPFEKPASAEDFLNRLKMKELEKKVSDYEGKIAEIREYVKKMEIETQETRTRLQRDQQRLVDQKLSQFFQEFLQVMDNLDLSVKSVLKENGPFVDGVRMIHQQFHELLKRSGLEKVQTQNEVFDPQFHEAISMIPVQLDEADGRVIDELKAGYRYKENLIRPAQVLVGKKSE